MLVLWDSLNCYHPNTAQCAKGEERKQRRMVAEEARAGTERAFSVYGRLITTMTLFKYLGHILTASYDDCPVVVGNLQK